MKTKLIPVTPEAFDKVFPGPLVMVSRHGRVYDAAFYAVDRDAGLVYARAVGGDVALTFDLRGAPIVASRGFPSDRTLQFCVNREINEGLYEVVE